MSCTKVNNNNYMGPNNGQNGRQNPWKDEGKMIPTRIYVGNLSSEINESDLAEFFKPFGEVSHIRIIRAGQYGYGDGRGRNYGFVTFHQVEVVKHLLQREEQLILRGRKLLLGQAQQRSWSSSRCSRQGWSTGDDNREHCAKAEEETKEEEVITDCPIADDGLKEDAVIDSQVLSYCDQECCRPYYYHPIPVYQGQQMVGVMPDGSWHYTMPTIVQPLVVGSETFGYIPNVTVPTYYPTQSNQLMYPVYCHPEVQQMTDIYNNNNSVYTSQQQNIMVSTSQQNQANLGSQGQVSVGNSDQVLSNGTDMSQIEFNDSDGNKTMRNPNEVAEQGVYQSAVQPPSPGASPGQHNPWHQYHGYNQSSSYQDQYRTGNLDHDWGSSSRRKRRNVRGLAKPNQGRGNWSVKPKHVDPLQGQIQKMKIQQ